jgi:hypothetical protein
MWDSPVYLEYAGRERMKELARATNRDRIRARLRPSRPCGLRRGLARRLVSLGLHLDPHATTPTAANGRPRLASR